MSAINKALSKLAEEGSASQIEQANVPNVSSGKPWLWLGIGFFCSLAVGSWALSSSRDITETSIVIDTHAQSQPVITGEATDASLGKSELARVDIRKNSSPTATATPELSDVIAVTEAPEVVLPEPVVIASKLVNVTPSTSPISTSKTPAETAPKQATKRSTEIQTAASKPQQEQGMLIEQVELTPAQLAEKAEARAKKALDANDMQAALAAYNEVLRYAPSDIVARQKLAALYFGKGDTRQAYETLQRGIERDSSDQTLRLALAKLLLKEKQEAAALSPLLYMPSQPDRDYLAMRAALAQKQQQNEIALESYQSLVAMEPRNARWWLGLAIQQERMVQYSAAVGSYNNALSNVGVSNQSQTFIRNRLALLKQLEVAPQ